MRDHKQLVILLSTVLGDDFNTFMIKYLFYHHRLYIQNCTASALSYNPFETGERLFIYPYSSIGTAIHFDSALMKLVLRQGTRMTKYI